MQSPLPRADTVHLTPYAHTLPPPPPRYEEFEPDRGRRQTRGNHVTSHDPRSSSTQSLVPAESASRSGRRTLLLVYIHGFLGNESSFQSFPAHVHNLVTYLLKDTHVVHTKIYPRYKSRKPIQYARDDFSNWICRHENPNTDVILLGHSMGGILSAEVVLLPPYSSMDPNPLRHRILGTVNFDTPFLGLHPGIVASGLSSLFKKSPSPDRKKSDDGSLAPISPLQSPALSDPTYNPPFPNDIHVPVRKGWDSAMHFVIKHADGLFKASKQYVVSHLEFGSCLLNLPEMKTRYNRVRCLEEGQQGMPHVRFINFYTASQPEKTAPTPRQSPSPVAIEMREVSPRAEKSASPRISVELHDKTNEADRTAGVNGLDDNIVTDKLQATSLDDASHEQNSDLENMLPSSTDDSASRSSLTVLSPDPSGAYHEIDQPIPTTSVASLDSAPGLPPLPSQPSSPSPAPLQESYPDKSTFKLAQKAHGRTIKAHKRAHKDWSSAVKDREKYLAKQAKQQAKQAKLASKTTSSTAAEQPSLSVPSSPTPAQSVPAPRASGPAKERRFCVLPPKIEQRDPDAPPGPPELVRDPAWVKVLMEGVDEVGAHCGLFFAGEVYERLVADVAARIETWVREDAGVDTPSPASTATQPLRNTNYAV